MKTGIFLLFLRFSASTVFFAYFNLHLFRILAVVFTVLNMENLINGLCVQCSRKQIIFDYVIYLGEYCSRLYQLVSLKYNVDTGIKLSCGDFQSIEICKPLPSCVQVYINIYVCVYAYGDIGSVECSLVTGWCQQVSGITSRFRW